MGGFGSGRPASGKLTTDDCRRLDVRQLQRDGLLQDGRAFSLRWSRNGQTWGEARAAVYGPSLSLFFRARVVGQDWQDLNQLVRLEYAPCHYGGERCWFRCPCCHKRVALLYANPSFACRSCHGLVYASQGETPAGRSRRKTAKIRTQLGWPADIACGSTGKPKGMHWKTYCRLGHLHNEHAMIWLESFGKHVSGMSMGVRRLQRRVARL